MNERYQTTVGDLDYRNAALNEGREGLHPFEEARLLRYVSHEYLATLAHDNTGERSAPMKALIDAEIARRGSDLTRRANRIAMAALAISVVAVIVAIFD